MGEFHSFKGEKCKVLRQFWVRWGSKMVLWTVLIVQQSVRNRGTSIFFYMWVSYDCVSVQRLDLVVLVILGETKISEVVSSCSCNKGLGWSLLSPFPFCQSDLLIKLHIIAHNFKVNPLHGVLANKSSTSPTQQHCHKSFPNACCVLSAVG